MYPISNDVLALFEAEQPKVLRITGTDKNGTAITITDNDVVADSFQLDRYACNGEKLEVGTAVAAQMTLKLFNGNGQFDDIVFEGTELNVEIGIADWSQASPVVTYVPCGLFTPDIQPRRMATISLTCLDRMTMFDVAVDATSLTFPATVAGLVGQACTACGVTLAQSIATLPNADVSVSALPSVNGIITYRNIIQWCAGIMATNAWMDWNGQLRFSWYNNSTSYVSTTDNRYSSDLYENDLTVTGVVYTNDSGIEIVEGTDDYALDLTGNALAGPLIATVLPAINTAVNGFAYRPFTAAVINAPYLWPMDSVVFTDKDGNNHASVLTNVAFGVNGTTALESKGMTEAINKLQAPVGVTKEQAQLISQAMEQVETDIDDSLTQQEIFNRLTDNGAAQGLVLLNGQLYVNASYIRSGTLVLGGQNNQNGTLQVLDANGNVVGTWDNNGVTILKGLISGPSMELKYNPVTGVSDAITLTRQDNGYVYGKLYVYKWPNSDYAEPRFALYDYDEDSYDPDYDISTPYAESRIGAWGLNFSLKTDDSGLTASEICNINIRGVEIKSKNADSPNDYFKIGYNGEARFTAVNITGALNVGDPATTRANLGITPANIGALPDTTTAADIGAVQNINIVNADIANAAALNAKLSQIPYSTSPSLRGAAIAYVPQQVMRAITGVATANGGFGYIVRNGTSSFMFNVTSINGNVIYVFSLTSTESEYSHGTVYQYTSTSA